MPITLGKDATLSVGGVIASVRNVTWSGAARTIEVEEYGVRQAAAYSTGFEYALSFEFNNSDDLNGLLLIDGTPVTVSGGEGAWSFPAIVTGITETDSLDGVVTYQVECRGTREGLR
jgi:hypothetical protein